MKKQSDEARHIYEAGVFAKYACQAKLAGEARRAVALYETALHHAISALDGCLKKDALDVDAVRQLYVSAALYAQEAGRHRKAEHLREQVSRFDECL